MYYLCLDKTRLKKGPPESLRGFSRRVSGGSPGESPGVLQEDFRESSWSGESNAITVREIIEMVIQHL